MAPDGIADWEAELLGDWPISLTKDHIYLAGPMTGIPEKNYKMFKRYEQHLSSLGFLVENPANHFGGRQDLTWPVYMARDIRSIIEKCYMICVLPGWEDSRGAQTEVALALELNLAVVWYDWDAACIKVIRKQDLEDVVYGRGRAR